MMKDISLKMLVFTFITLLTAVFASDYRCTKDGGICQDYRSSKCTGGYVQGLCDGNVNRRCCQQCDAACRTNEEIYAKKDEKCTSGGGYCIHNGNFCVGLYATGKCGGPASRQCCETVSISDNRCTKDGGTCQDYRSIKCTGGYVQGLCAGDFNRRCCQKCDAACLANEEIYSSKDGKCTSAGGHCIHNGNFCAGSYASGKCGGPAARQCCETEGGKNFGNIMNLDTTGASCVTAQQSGLNYCGVPASRTLALADAGRMRTNKCIIKHAASDMSINASIIAGIISRESQAGRALTSNGFGGDGHGYGLMQVDDRYHTIRGGPHSLEHIKQGTEILIEMINGVKAKHPSWTQDMALKGGISAYNAGVKNVVTYANMDVGTTGNDYANDVVARARWYSDNGY